MQGARDLFASERGIFCCFALVCVTVLASLGVIDGDRWLSFVRDTLLVLVASKTVTTAIETMKRSPIPKATAVEKPPGL